MDNYELRLECLKLAQSSGVAISLSPAANVAILDRARAYADFVLQQSGPKPMQAKPATPETEADPQNPSAPGHEGAGYVSPPTT